MFKIKYLFRVLSLALCFIFFTSVHAGEIEFSKMIDEGDDSQRELASDLLKQPKSDFKQASKGKTPASVSDAESKGLKIKLKYHKKKKKKKLKVSN